MKIIKNRKNEKKNYKITGYVSKGGNLGTYKIVANFKTEEGVEKVKLESFGDVSKLFWVEKSKLCDAPPPIRRPDEPTQQCWECGCSFTYRESKHNDGDWSDSYCGC